MLLDSVCAFSVDLSEDKTIFDGRNFDGFDKSLTIQRQFPKTNPPELHS